jgi:RNA-directed DNA polymerase
MPRRFRDQERPEMEGHRRSRALARMRSVRRARERRTGRGAVPLSEGDRSGGGTTGGESEHLDSTGEAGEPTQGTRWREERCRETELLEGKVTGTPISEDTSTRLQRIAQLAREDPERAFLSLAHHIDIELLREAYRRTRKHGAVGVDGQTAAEYEEELQENLRSLLDRFKSGRYKAPPVRRVHIPKGDGESTRPIGIPAFEDKVLQRAVSMVLEAVYEQDFLDCSYGFRPGRSAHQALEALWHGLMDMGGGWILDVDIKSFFDTIPFLPLRAILDQRVRDGVLRRTIDKWLAAGVMEDGAVSYADAGTPQGGVVSPLLANVYLHEVVDRWFETEVKPWPRGRTFMIRFADDLVVVTASEADANEAKAMLAARLGQYGLSLHPTKTRIVAFHPRSSAPRSARPGTFDFLGFTHYWDRSHKGRWAVRRKTAASRFRRTLRRLSDWCRRNRHRPVAWQHDRIVKALRGHYNYFGIIGNRAALERLRNEVRSIWRKWLDRRSQKGRMPWPRFVEFLKRHPLPMPVAQAAVS